MIEQLLNPGILILSGMVVALYIGVLILRNMDDPKKSNNIR